jgi:hypothetical protein
VLDIDLDAIRLEANNDAKLVGSTSGTAFAGHEN